MRAALSIVRVASIASFVAVASVASTEAKAEVVGDEYSSSSWGISLTAPRNWQLAEQTSYPNILLWAVRTNPRGRMLLSAERLESSTDGLAYALRTSKALEDLGFTVRPPQLHAATGAYWVDFDNGHTFLRQAFLVANGIGFAITLSADDARTRNQHLRAFDYLLRNLKTRKPVTAPSPPAPTADTPAAPAGVKEGAQ